MSFSFQDTILAISTPFGKSLRAIIRLSGKDVFSCISSAFVPDDPGGLEDILSGKGFHSCQGRIYLEKEKITIPACIYIMNTPNSYTKEDVVEIHTFGSPPLLEMLMETLLLPSGRSHNYGVDDEGITGSIRIAEPGEFTKRAFLNGRITLAGAESVLHIIRSQTDSELLMAVSNLKGRLAGLMNGIQGELVKLCARIEAAIDFMDQDIELISPGEIEKQLEHAKRRLRAIAGDGQKPGISHHGVKAVLTGLPNVGKSSLFNKLLDYSKAIVTPVSGTTRDTLEAEMEIEGIHFRIIDTAGTTYAGDELESIIAQRADVSVDAAQIVLFVLDGCVKLGNAQIESFDSIITKNKIVVISKSDLTQEVCDEDIPSIMKAFPVVKTSALSGGGLDELKKVMVSCVFENNIDVSASDIVFTIRQKVIVCNALEILEQMSDSLNDGIGYELVSIDLRKTVDTISEVTGEILTDDILEIIFSEFCVGK